MSNTTEVSTDTIRKALTSGGIEPTTVAIPWRWVTAIVALLTVGGCLGWGGWATAAIFALQRTDGVHAARITAVDTREIERDRANEKVLIQIYKAIDEIRDTLKDAP